MEQNRPTNKESLKPFFIKLISIVIAIIVTINVLYNLILSERLEKIDKILLMNDSQFREGLKDKIRKELYDGLEKDHMLSVEDKKLLYKIYQKIKKEFRDLETIN
tara:strand:- start:347 stop:661 length:315 start_codon:yes stop_codon:yes gene_type:complete